MSHGAEGPRPGAAKSPLAGMPWERADQVEIGHPKRHRAPANRSRYRAGAQHPAGLGAAADRPPQGKVLDPPDWRYVLCWKASQPSFSPSRQQLLSVADWCYRRFLSLPQNWQSLPLWRASVSLAASGLFPKASPRRFRYQIGAIALDIIILNWLTKTHWPPALFSP